jgi:NADH-quinone oxidoreductase subunit J
VSAGVAYALYLALAVGALGVYCLMPRTDSPKLLVGALLGGGALLSLLLVLGSRLAIAGEGVFFFGLFAVIALVGAVRVVTHPRPVYSAIWFVLVVVAVAALLVLQSAEFAAIALVIVYAGAILVTYIFVIMLARQGGSPLYDRKAREPFLAVVAGFLLAAAVTGNIGHIEGMAPAAPEFRVQPVALTGGDGTTNATNASAAHAESNSLAVGWVVMTRYVIVLEIAGVLLLVAMVGAIALSRKRLPPQAAGEPEEPLGRIGREVEPF